MLSESFILHFPEHISRSHGYVICPNITQDKNSIFTKSHTVGAGSMYYYKIWRYMQEPRNTSKKNKACQVMILNTLANWYNTVHELLGDSMVTIDEDMCYLLAWQESGHRSSACISSPLDSFELIFLFRHLGLDLYLPCEAMAHISSWNDDICVQHRSEGNNR